MPDTRELLDRHAAGADVHVDAFGGPSRLLADFDELFSYDPVSTIVLLCEEADSFGDMRTAWTDAVVRAAETEQFDIDEVHDVILRSPEVLEVARHDLLRVIRIGAQRPGLWGDVFTESWTRLALGDMSPGLPLRAHLQERATEAAVNQDTSPFLVRAIAAAVNRWADPDLVSALAGLRTVVEHTSTVEFELGMYALGIAGTADDDERALEHLRDAISHLHDAGDRADALAFGTPLKALLRYIDGDSLTAEDVLTARSRVDEYLLGYAGLNRHWRQGRADTSRSWSILLSALADASSADADDWFEPSDIIQAASSLYTEQMSVDVVTLDPDEPTSGRAVTSLLRPRLLQSFRSHAPSVRFIDEWLRRARAARLPDVDLIAAVEKFRDAVVDDDRPKVSRGPADRVRSAFPLNPQLDRFFHVRDAASMLATRIESDLTRRIIGEISAIQPDAAAACGSDLFALAFTLVQFTSFHLNQKQTGQRKIPWLGAEPDSEGHLPKEYVLSDALNTWFHAANLHATVEAAHSGGGDADLAVTFPTSSFFIEVKRVLTVEEDADAFEHYGDQAVQYAVSTTPIVFLALLDYVQRTVRIDLDGVVWTRPHQPTLQSRVYALTGFRVQASAASPSVSSRTRGRPAPPI